MEGQKFVPQAMPPEKRKEMNPLALAFIGDGVFEMLVREFLVGKGNCPVRKLHARAVEMVNCKAQAGFLKEKLYPVLTEEEQAVCLRGRNAHVGHVPKNADIADYHSATALEAVFGYLYLKGEMDRIRELFGRITAEEKTDA